MDDLIERLRDAAADAAAEEYGVSGLLREAADAIEAARAEREVIGAEAVKYAEKSGRLEAKVGRLAEALLELCSVIDGHEVPVAVEGKAAHARAALRDHDQETRET